MEKFVLKRKSKKQDFGKKITTKIFLLRIKRKKLKPRLSKRRFTSKIFVLLECTSANPGNVSFFAMSKGFCQSSDVMRLSKLLRTKYPIHCDIGLTSFRHGMCFFSANSELQIEEHLSPEKCLTSFFVSRLQVYNLKPEQQLQLYHQLKENLEGRSILNAS